MSKFFEGLNPSQKLAVETVNGTVQIISVAGSGKTRVLTHRIAYMVNDLGIKPENILATTFTKKATEEMETRLSSLLSKTDLENLVLGTSHSIAYRILKKEYAELNHPMTKAFGKGGLLVNYEQKKFCNEIKKALQHDKQLAFDVRDEMKKLAIPAVLREIGLAKNNGIDCYEYERMHQNQGLRQDTYNAFFKRYEEQKFMERKIDFDDMLPMLIELLETDSGVLTKYQQQFTHIMVDETQDNNSLQYRLIKLLGYPQNNIFIVGDDDQSMYAFRGAKPNLFIRFAEDYPNVKQISLEDNYRSNPQILAVANKLIENNTERLVKSLKANKKNDVECVHYTHYADELAEAESAIEEIKILNEKEGYALKKIAILYRTNAQSKSFEDALIQAGLPYVIHGGYPFYKRREVVDIINYLRLAVNPNDNKAFEGVINVPSRYLGEAFMKKVKAVKGSHYNAVGNIYMKDYERKGVANFKSIVEALKEMNDNKVNPTDMVNYILFQGGYEEHLRQEQGEEEDEGNSRLENIVTMKYALAKFDTLEKFLAYIDKMQNTAKHSIDGVQLMTIHKSKGLEFPVTFVAGASDGLLPHNKAVEAFENETNPMAIEEERRLMYVAVTRAEEKVYISSVVEFNGKYKGKSEFIEEMGLESKELHSEEEQEAGV